MANKETVQIIYNAFVYKQPQVRFIFTTGQVNVRSCLQKECFQAKMANFLYTLSVHSHDNVVLGLKTHAFKKRVLKCRLFFQLCHCRVCQHSKTKVLQVKAEMHRTQMVNYSKTQVQSHWQHFDNFLQLLFTKKVTAANNGVFVMHRFWPCVCERRSFHFMTTLMSCKQH